ncbi:MAG: acetyltransferase [Pseudomonadales bacterium]
MAKVIIFGLGKISEIANYYLEHDSKHEIVAFTVDPEYMSGDTFLGRPVLDFSTLEESHPPGEYSLFIPISYHKINQTRAQKYLDAKSRGYDFISFISSQCQCHADSIGENCFIFENNVIQPFTRIGDNCIIWSGNHIGHHSVIEDHCFISSHAVISGNVKVGVFSFIGVNATLRDNITIGKSNVIGAGSLILSNTEDLSVYSTKETPKAKVTSDRLRGI